jgi:hypothetical protein
MAVFQLDPKRRIRQEFPHNTGKFEQFFLGHGFSYMDLRPPTVDEAVDERFFLRFQGNNRR